MRKLWLAVALLLNACGGSSNSNFISTQLLPSIAPTTPWQLQLQGGTQTTSTVKLYEVDLFDTSPARIAELKATGAWVVCYFSAGSAENWRSDYGHFKAEVLGSALDGWAGENWLDIRATSLRSIMENRLKLAQEKGCHAVDPDNVDGFANATGFNLSAADQLLYNKFLAISAHQLGLSIALKNDLIQAEALEPYFDFAVNEQCIALAECEYLAAFKRNHKLIINIEYELDLIATTAAKTQLCQTATNHGLMTKLLTLALDGTEMFSCF